MRSRVLGGYILLVGAALVVALVVQWSWLRQRVDDAVDREVAQVAAEFQQVAVSGVDPETGDAFGGDVGGIASAWLRSHVAVTGTGVVVYSQGEPVRADLPGSLLVEDGALDAWGDVDEATTAVVDTARGPVRLLATPIEATDQAAGVLVVGVELAPRLAEVTGAVRTAGLVSLAVFVLASVAAWWWAGRVLDPLHRLRTTVEDISEHDLGARVPVTGGDELAGLAVTFNGTLDRLAASFDRQRRFVDDAGHELRTPITIVRGQLELLDDDPAERDEVLGLVDGELERMERIVDDLLVLAQAGEPQFVAPRPVDLPDLVTDLRTRATALLGRPVPGPPAPSLVVHLDQQRVVQAVMNLVGNAHQHAPADADVRLGADVVDDTVQLWVHDDGPGIPPDQLDHVVQRFARGDVGPRGGGAGLGLAIVSAIAGAHGGVLDIDSRPGDTTIRLVLPHAVGDRGPGDDRGDARVVAGERAVERAGLDARAWSDDRSVSP